MNTVSVKTITVDEGPALKDLEQELKDVLIESRKELVI